MIRPIIELFLSLTLVLILALGCEHGRSKPPATAPQFSAQKVAAAPNSFYFLRAFVEYFYHLTIEHKARLQSIDPNLEFTGWCAGDAHPENFGALLLSDGSSTFTVNDMDDAGPCPVILDILRLAVSTRLYHMDIGEAQAQAQTEQLLDSYIAGIADETRPVPSPVERLLAESVKLGSQVKKSVVVINPKAGKNKEVPGSQFAKDSDFESVTDSVKADIIKKLTTLLKSEFSVWDVVAVRKAGGGSGGLLRYQVLVHLKNAPPDKSLLHLELKTLVQPALWPVATGAIPTQFERIKKTVEVEIGAKASPHLSVIEVASGTQDFLPMLVRPRFAGNRGVNLAHGTSEENNEIIKYSAFQLGRIHRKSVSQIEKYLRSLKKIERKSFEKDVQFLATLFQEKFKEQKAIAH